MADGSSPRTEAFVAYVTERRPALRRFAYLLTGDWHAAEDLVQIALTKLYVAWPRIESDAAQDAYARRIVVRSHLDERRRPWRRERPGLDGVDATAPDAMPSEHTDALLVALRALPARQRATVVLRFWCDRSVEQTAEELGVSTGTVKSQTARATATLRTMLDPDPTPTIPTMERGRR